MTYNDPSVLLAPMRDEPADSADAENLDFVRDSLTASLVAMAQYGSAEPIELLTTA